MNDLKLRLTKRKESGNLRSLPQKRTGIDFCSNDYLGHARSALLAKQIESNYKNIAPERNGSTGSRLLTGNSVYAELLEENLADFFHSEASLLFNSGYLANLGLLSSVPQRGDTIIFDSLIHASIRSGLKLSNAKTFSFKHNYLKDLKKKLINTTGNVYVVVESVYSMDGDFCPLEELANICHENGCRLIVDEAHSTGLWGENGNGLVCELGLESKTFARVYTFGKAIGVEGAVVAGSQTLINYLVNFSSPFIYTTAPSLHSLVAIKSSFDFRNSNPAPWLLLQENIKTFAKAASSLFPKSNLKAIYLESNSAIQAIIVPGNEEAKAVAKEVNKLGFDIRPILAPTVPKGEERLRICLHSFNKKEEIEKLVKMISKIAQ